MARNAFSKAMRAGTAGALAVGLAVVLAVVLGIATTAIGATGGNFILGKANVATTASKLTASIAGSALTLVNNSTGAATALNISVASGKAPLKVNASAGTATNLSADKLDGKDSAQFAAGVGGKAADAFNADRAVMAADAEKLDGKDSSEFLTATTYTSESPPTSGENVGNGSGIHAAGWRCDQGDELLTGGYRWTVNSASLAVVGSWPSNNTWLVQWANTSDANQPYQMVVYVKCADTAAPAHD